MDRTTGGALTRPPQGVAGAVLLLGVLLAGAAPLIPLAVLVSRHEPELLPLFAVPMAVLVAAWRIARDRARDQLTDPLTGLPNRHALLLAAQESIAEHEAEEGYSVGLILLDLDRFRSLNDTLGHAAGDRLLVHIGRRLHRVLRGGQLDARPGLPGAGPGTAPPAPATATGYGAAPTARLDLGAVPPPPAGPFAAAPPGTGSPAGPYPSAPSGPRDLLAPPYLPAPPGQPLPLDPGPAVPAFPLTSPLAALPSVAPPGDPLGQLGAADRRRETEELLACLPPAAEHARRAVVARMGGDEFAVLLPGVGHADTLERLAKALIAELAAPIRLDGLLLVLEASAGVCVYPQHAGDAESLLRRADVAMGHAQRGRTGVEQYDHSQDADTPYRIGLLGDLRRALETGEVQLHYQPKVAFDGRVVGLEALLRWERPGRGKVSPDEFVGLAESSGLMPRLTDYVLEAAIGQLAAWRGQGLQVQVAVNVSPRDVLNPGFAERVAAHLSRHQVPAHALQLEITERLLLDDSRRAADTLAELRRHGVGMSLDDFGTGHSSLVRLRSLPVGELKIDRSFVSRMVADDHDAAVVRCSVELAHSLGLTVVAEGVEDDETWERLHGLGVDAVQGWLVSAALPADQATAWLRVHRTGPPSAERLTHLERWTGQAELPCPGLPRQPLSPPTEAPTSPQ
ncbi:bifunctional diguanylate cyclase/phosphodiesterase [Kitasatospora sp. NBC_01250]|uniref:putative bifunctional diguanylate cyclase/phosphodiesterase n=1 Tax=unclassified Kitasatospora TaxID=2633591 RepID=UPI002E12CEDD|nr:MULTISPECIES: bifunctional diguanylate cyclase/phosphodiesterase [unclassified Kitasatospora]WSJ69354.1 bifunctional diguanylate cyclase/phosphodiesterase [Kitasatospora sp. NBC_01302]